MAELEELKREIGEVRIMAEDALDKFPIRSTTTPGASRERHIHDLGKHPGGVIAARVYNDANISIPNATGTTLTFNQERFDTDTIHSTSSNTGRLTCKTAGKYIIVGNIRWADNVNGRRFLDIRFNGATEIGRTETAILSAETTQNVTTIYDLAVDDYLELRPFQSSGGALNVVATSNISPEFMMSRVGAAGTTGGGVPGTDHGSLTGLSDDDHPPYLLAAGTRAGSTGSAQDFGSTGIKADVIAESTGAAGVTIDGVILKDSGITVAANIVMGDNSVTGIDTLTFTDVNGTIAGIQNQNLLDKSAAENVAGAWTFNTAEADVDFRIAGDNDTNLFFTDASTDRVGIGTATPAVKFQCVGPIVSDGSNRVLWDAIDTTAMASGVGAGMNFGGKFTSGGSIAGWAGIMGQKENGTSGNFAGTLVLLTRPAGGNTSIRMVISSTGLIRIGTTAAVAGQVHIDQANASGNLPVLFLDQGDTGESCLLLSSDGADRDIDLFRVNVGGVPKLMWDESDDDFSFNKGLDITGNIVVSGTVDGVDIAARDHAEYTDAEAITAVQGEATLDLAGDVTIDGAKSLSVDVINEKDSAAGVTIDGVRMKDSAVRLGTGGITLTSLTSRLSTTGGLVIAADPAIIYDGGDDARIRMNLNGTMLFFDEGGTTRYTIASSAPHNAFVGAASIDQSSTSGAQPVLKLDQADVDDSFIDFIGTSAADATKSISTNTTSGTTTHHVRVEINGANAWIAVSTNDPT